MSSLLTELAKSSVCDTLPPTILTRFFSHRLVDKSNIGYVTTGSFIQDTDVSPNVVSMALLYFTITYVPLHPISTVASFRVGPRFWIAGLLFSCGTISILHMLVNNDTTIKALRLLLGVSR